MILCDTGPLVALADQDDAHHTACAHALPSLRGPLVTTWPCFTEAMHLLERAGGDKTKRALWKLRKTGKLFLREIRENEADRMEVLMEKYRDAPMDLADASLVAAAEVLSVFKIFTLDKHFHAYRIHDAKPFEVVP